MRWPSGTVYPSFLLRRWRTQGSPQRTQSPSHRRAQERQGTAPTAGPLPPLTGIGNWLHGLTGRGIGPVVSMGFVLLALGVAVAGFWPTARPGATGNLAQGTQVPNDLLAGLAVNAVATLIDSADCDWSDTRLPVQKNSRLPSGWLQLASGMAAIQFDCGTTVLLEGPAEFALNSAECGTLRFGKLVSKAAVSDPANSGFTILTGNTEVVDLGTEFGVYADDSGSTEVHVFNGVARVRQRGVLHGAVPERFLRAGQATRFDSKPVVSVVDSVNRLDSPVGIAFGPDENLYVASRFTDSILRYDGRTGALLDTFVPPRSGDLNNPFFLTFGPDGNLYVSSTGNHAVLRYDGATGAFLDAFVPPRSGGIAGPMGLAFGRDGNLYVASSGKQTVCRFDGKTGEPLGPLFEQRSGGLDGATGIAFAPNGDLWIADRNRDCVLRFDGSNGRFLEQLRLDGRLKFPFDVAFSPSGKLYVASHSNHHIQRYDPETGEIANAVEASQEPAWPHALSFGPDGRLYCTSDSANAVMRYNADTGKFVDTFVVGWQNLTADRENFVRKMPELVVCNTGISRAGKRMQPGEHCPRWFIEKSPDLRFIPPGPAVVTDALAGWMPNSNRSSWLSVAPMREDYRAAAGTYIFYAGFEVDAQDLQRARLVGTAWTPQELVEIQINKRPVSARIERNADGQSAQVVIDDGFVEGLNFVYFIVNNSDEGPVAFRAEIEYVRGRDQTAQLDADAVEHFVQLDADAVEHIAQLGLRAAAPSDGMLTGLPHR